MPSQYFSPKTTNDGAALYVSFNSKEQYGYLKFIKQVSWDATKRQGSFKGGKVLNVKLSLDEIGDICQSIRNKSSCSFYHSFKGQVTSGKFTYYEIQSEDKSVPSKKGFGIQFKKDDLNYKIGLTLGAAERLYEYFRFAFDHINSAIYIADKKEFESRKKIAEAEMENTELKKEALPNPELEKTESEPTVVNESDVLDF